MEIVEISKKRFNNLEFYDEGFEGCIFKIDIKTRWNYEQKLLKKLYIDNGNSFANKILTITTLIENKKKLECEELIIPEKLAIVSKKVSGYIMPYVESITLEKYLDNSEISNIDKIDALKQAGNILKKVDEIREYQGVTNFHLGDIHEQNFIVDRDKKVRVIDLDSARIMNNEPFGSKYLYNSNIIEQMNSKYTINVYGINIPNEDSDIYCYIIMILNYISGVNLCKISIPEFYEYMEYLNKLGLNKEIIECFEKICELGPNINPIIYLDDLKNITEEYKYNNFKKYIKR